MKWTFLVVFCGLAATASAQSVYKCRDAKGNPVYQSNPCPEAEKRWDTQPRDYTWDDYYKRTAADKKIERDRRHMRARAAQVSGSSGPVGAAVGQRNSSACESAKRRRDMVYEAAGADRSFATSRAMSDVVYDACK
ncbi:DUF4124 domain-containing protein [Pseudoxanthomonas putridarboris]|uniref:DUF4124 domain-containing protein n=1 Tax=Pseudoxanthomonas putridarboris TaxID=752605 RepID=A0ABU9IZJ3_9GAMM